MFRKGTLRQLTSDHISGGDEMNRGITRFMGMSSDSVPFEQRHEAVKDGDMFLLCSDGLTRHVNDQEIAGIMARQEPGAACRALLSKAMARGGKDNITLQIISCKEEPLLKVLLLAVSLSILAFLCLLPFFTMHHDRASQVKKGKQAIPASQKKANRGLPMKKVKEIRNQRHHDREDKKNGISYIERLSIY
jgi:sulfur transfer complex TusBCD TusB component (DsrH family)